MKKLVLISMVVFLFALLTAGTGTAVAATYPNANCLACHGPGGSAVSHVDFTVPMTLTGKVNKANCYVCHKMLGHAGVTLVIKNGVTIGKFKSAASVDFDPVMIHEYHSGNRPNYGCTGKCHQRAACQSCHGSVSHNLHGSLTSPMVMVCDGNGAYTGGVGYGVILQACANDFCHKSYAVEGQPYCAGCHDGTQPQFDTVNRTLGHGGYSATQHTASSMDTTYRNYACNKCHVTELKPEHVKTSSSSAAASCNACHPTPRNTLLPTWNKTCSQGGCHTASSGAGSVHTADAAKHTSTATQCLTSGCHGSDVSVLHAATTADNGTTSCGISNIYGACHTSALTATPTVTDCATCHQDKTPTNHGYSATQHTASSSGTSCFSGGCHTRTLKEEHDKFYTRVPGLTNSCQLCHTILTGQTQTLATKAKAAGGGAWDKTCAQICHTEIIHAEQTTLHKSTTTDCTSCHGTDVGTMHTTCDRCHSQTKIPTTTNCTASGCHPGYTADHFAANCNLCHSSNMTYKSTETHKKHVKKVLCGGCHKVVATTPAKMCTLCHGTGKTPPTTSSKIRDLHKSHVKKMGMGRDVCEACHGSATPTSFSKLGSGSVTSTTICKLCHDNETYSSSTNMYQYCQKHEGKVACEGCHQGGFSKPKSITEACKVCHSYKSASRYEVHKKHVGKAWCSTCHQMGVPVAGKDCSKCHGTTKTYQQYSTHKTHAGEQFMCLTCHGSGTTPPPPSNNPVANAGLDKTATVGQSVSFNGSLSTDPDGSVVSWSWNFGDGKMGSGVTTSHTYLAAGTYTVTLTVTDNAGATGTDTANVTVIAPSDLALSKPISASSQRTGYEASKANDGNTLTRWCSTGRDTEWLMVDLGTSQAISKVVIRWYGSNFASSWRVQVSSDNSTWSSVYSTTEGTSGTKTITFSSRSARYVRIYCTRTSSWSGYSISDFGVYR